MTIYIAPLCALIGLVLFFAVKTNGEVKEVGKWMFVTGLLVTLLTLANGKAFHLL